MVETKRTGTPSGSGRAADGTAGTDRRETVLNDAHADAEALVSQRIDEHLDVVAALRDRRDAIAEIARIITEGLRAGGKVLAFGNGGSAADAMHFVGELVGRYYLERRALPAVALSANASILTSVANDYDFDRVFERQVEALGRPGDVAVGISTSGRSLNVLAALRRARKMGLTTVGMTGSGPEAMAAVTDACLSVPSSDTPRIQEAHITAIHIICEWVEREMAPS